MKRLLITLFSTGLLLSTVQVRPESHMLNWTKNELSKVAWGQGASAVAGDAKAVGSFVYSQLPSKQAMKDVAIAGGNIAKDGAQKAFAFGKSQLPSKEAVQAAAVAGKDMIAHATNAGISFVKSNSDTLFGTGLFGAFTSAYALFCIEHNYSLTGKEKEQIKQTIVKYALLPSLVTMGISAYSATR